MVLIVDDEPLVRDLLRQFLELYGFRTVAARSGREAIDLFEQHGQDVSLVLLDVCMPGLSGPETLRELRRIDPHVRCCFMSGNLGDYEMEEIHALGALQFFSKPFRLDELLDAIRALTEEK
jgi:CheY-like chemotaxis protein